MIDSDRICILINIILVQQFSNRNFNFMYGLNLSSMTFLNRDNNNFIVNFSLQKFFVTALRIINKKIYCQLVCLLI